MSADKRKALFLNLKIALVSILSCVITLEIGLRLVGYGEIKEGSHTYLMHSHYNPFLIFGPRINQKFEQDNGEAVFFNSQGFRLKDDLPLSKPIREYRVFALGGSTTENIANQAGRHYAGEAEQILNGLSNKYDDIRFINVGKSSFSAAHSLIRFQFDILPLNPDMITVMHNINDLMVNLFPRDDRLNYANKYLHRFYAPTVSLLGKRILQKSRTFILAYRSLRRITGFFAKELPSVPLDDGTKVYTSMRFGDKKLDLFHKKIFRNTLVSMVAVAKSHGAEIVLMSQPASFSEAHLALSFGHKLFNNEIIYPKLEQFKSIFEEYNEVIEEVAKDEGAYFIDMYRLFGSDKRYFIDLNHFTAEGIERFGRLYAESLKKIITNVDSQPDKTSKLEE